MFCVPAEQDYRFPHGQIKREGGKEGRKGGRKGRKEGREGGR
jgi:hypothetical protein